MDDLDKRIAEANEEFVAEEEEVVTPPPVDILQVQRDVQRDYAKKQFPRGARAQVNATIQDVINGAGTDSLARAYKRAKDNSEVLEEMGDHRRAQLVRNQYMQERFLPAVEVVINFTSPDELLNSREGLKTLDGYALGMGSMSGYTEAYIRKAYGDSLGAIQSASSPNVTDAVMRINGYLDSDQMLSARALANKTKKAIDDGKDIASEEDYNLVAMVAKA